MERLYEVLSNCCPTIDFKQEKELMTRSVIDSVDLVSIIAAVEEEFGVDIGMDSIVPENFDNAESMWKLIESLR